MNDWPPGWFRDEGEQHTAGPVLRPTPGNPYGLWPAPPPAQKQPVVTQRRRFWGQPGRHGRRIIMVAGGLVMVLLVVAAAGYLSLDSKLNRTVTLPVSTVTSVGQNWLITGSDSRQGLTRQQASMLHTGTNPGTSNSDSIMLLHIGAGQSALISIPRDSYVPIPGSGTNKINAALGFGGPPLLTQTIENATGLHIDHYLGIGFGGLVTVVDKAGGIQVCLPVAVSDADSGANLPAGCQTLNGTQALELARDRHSFAAGDLQREQNQRMILKAILTRATNPVVYLNPLAAVPFATTAAGSVSTDQGTHLYNLTKVAEALRNPLTGMVPVADANFLTTNAGDAVLWDRAGAQQLFGALKNDQPVPAGLLGRLAGQVQYE